MYRYSRAIYRELAPKIQGDEVARSQARHHVLKASEETIWRLATDGRYFARPSRALFNEIRDYFPLAEQVRVYMVVDCYLGQAIEFLEAMPRDGQPRQCPANTRKGTPCRRNPRSGGEYCPSHMHLEESFGRIEGSLSGPDPR